MRNRSHTVLFFGMVAAVTAVCAARSLDAQTAKTPAQSPAKPAPARAATLPRTADGHPDFQGTYDVATTTPIERPAEFKTPTLTPQQAQRAVPTPRRIQHLIPELVNDDNAVTALAEAVTRIGRHTFPIQITPTCGGRV